MEKKYKSKIRVPTEKQYAYLELDFNGTPEEIVDVYDNFVALTKYSEGIPRKEFNLALDTYLTKNKGSTQQYLDMSPQQQLVFQELKRAFKRITKK